MNIKIVCVGKLKEKYWTQAVEEYLKRIGRFAKIEVAELKETRISDRPSAAEEESEQFAKKLSELALAGRSSIAFVIGGSLGLSQEVSARADFKLSFSPMTFPHQMMRVILLEQVYRCFKINNNETYHK